MKLSQLIVNCIKESNHDENNIVNVDSLKNGKLAQDPEYSADVNNVMLSINKAISRFVTAEKLPFRTVAINSHSEETIYNLLDDISFKDIKNSFKSIKAIYQIVNGNVVWLPYNNLDRFRVKLPKDLNGLIYITYAPLVKHFTDNDLDIELDDYDITDEMCSYITYFAKSELYEQAEPDRCKRYLNYFENFMQEMENKQTYPHQNVVQSRYKIK